ncbi:tumor rejection antigen P815A-like [Apodemus sylvaticus]|uniref:tumor rejection antigen P815A-like n=1 Tax=Apodemus sylvaticus TaxID=10129 RepID=UPI002243456A|nr:tumor rejection antigen P815A-like [Apodemus sylvaticus]
MSDKGKPDKGDSGSGGDGDVNRSTILNPPSREDILRYLGWLIFFVATTSSLAFQLLIQAIHEEQDERDVAWIARQSKYMSSVDGEDEDYEDDYDDYDDYDDDDDDFYDDDDEDEELENLMDDESEADGAEDEMSVELTTGATYFFDFGPCSCVPGHHLRKDEVKCYKIYVFQHPNFLASIPTQPKEPMGYRCENADEEVAMEEEEEEEEEGEEEEEDDEEMGNLDGENKKNPDSAEGPSP